VKNLSYNIKVCILVLTVILILIAGIAGAQQNFEEWLASDNKFYSEFVKAEEDAFNSYKADIEKKWGEFQESDKKQWVTYGTDKDTKAVVNFEDGYVEIEAVVDVSDPNALDNAQEKIGSHLQELIDATDESGELLASGEKELVEKQVIELEKIKSPNTDTMKRIDDRIIEAKKIVTGVKEKVVSGTALFKDMLKTHSGDFVSKLNVAAFSKKAALESKVEDRFYTGNDGIERLRVKVRIPMVPDHLRKRAERYLPDAREFCNKYKLDIAMIMGLMHTESYFNPKAKSHAPAYGLMQLVPRSGGREAYKYVYGKEKKPSARYLYVPRNNIELGTAYLQKMRTHEFKDITNSVNALYCIICAYNTGPGNVAKAITGEQKLKRAIEKINKMSPEKLYKRLRGNLPYDETRNYIKRVTERADNYVSWR